MHRYYGWSVRYNALFFIASGAVLFLCNVALEGCARCLGVGDHLGR